MGVEKQFDYIFDEYLLQFCVHNGGCSMKYQGSCGSCWKKQVIAAILQERTVMP